MSFMVSISILVSYAIVQTKSEWNCEEDKRKCVCEYGSCDMMGSADYVEYICANTAASCTIYCRDEYSCSHANFYMMATENTEIVCHGKDSCSNSDIYCGESNMKSCHIKIHAKAMSDGHIKCDGNISQCNVEIISDLHQIAMQRTTFECLSPDGCQLNGCHHGQCLQSHMHCIHSSCSCVGKDCESNIKIHKITGDETPLYQHRLNRHLLQLNSTTTQSQSSDLSFPDFTVMEYIVIAVSLVFCCGTCAIFVVICYCQRLKYHVIKRYRTSQSIQKQAQKELQNHSNESSETNTSNMNSNSNCDSCETVSIEIHNHEDDGCAAAAPQYTNNTTNKSNESTSTPAQHEMHDSDMKTDTAMAIAGTSQKQHPTPIYVDVRNSPFNNLANASYPRYHIESAVAVDEANRHHYHHVYYVANHGDSPVPYPIQFSSQFPSSGPSLPYSPTTTYHHHEAQGAGAATGAAQSQCATSLITGHHPAQTLQIPNSKLQYPPKSNSNMSNASTLTSVTSTRYDALPACLAPTSCSSDVSVASSNGSIYVCRFEESLARRSSLRDILSVFSQPGSQPTQRTNNSKDFALKGLCDTILNDEISNTVRAMLPDMDLEKSLSETPEPHALSWYESNKDSQCSEQLLKENESTPPKDE